MNQQIAKIEIVRFDDVEFRVLDSAHSGGYFQENTEYGKRALVLMKEGYFQENPVNNWWKSGWNLTEAGKVYYSAFLSALRDKHGHTWMTHKDTNPDLYDGQEESEYANSFDFFAYESGYCNGYVCKACGYSFCQHCTSEFNVPECHKRKRTR